MSVCRPPVAELSWRWGELLLDTQHHAVGSTPFIGTSALYFRYSFLGVPLATLSGAWQRFVRHLPPLLSVVEPEPGSGLHHTADSIEQPFLRWHGDTLVAHLPAEHRYSLLTDGAHQPDVLHAADNASAIALRSDQRLILHLGATTLTVSMTTAPRGITSRPSDEVDYPFVGALSLAAFAGSVATLLLLTAPAPISAHATSTIDAFSEHVVMLVSPPKAAPVVQSPPGAERASSASGGAPAQPVGTRGHRDAALPNATSGRAPDHRSVASAGILGAWSAAGMDSLGRADLSSDLADSIGLLSGPVGVALGSGLGHSHTGPVGGGSAEGLGGWGPSGVGPGSNPFGDGSGDCGDCTGKSDGTISTYDEPIVFGVAVDRSLVQEVVKRHLSQIRFCYQRELQREPGIGGKVVVRFTIATDGSVSSASTGHSTLNNPSVESCINGRFMRMSFPELGGTTLVSYPFVFSPG